MSVITFIGTLNGIDNYNKIKIIVNEYDTITKKINDIINPYKIINNVMECYISVTNNKELYQSLANEYKGKLVNVTVTIKRYFFNGKKGTSLVLKNMEILDNIE